MGAEPVGAEPVGQRRAVLLALVAGVAVLLVVLGVAVLAPGGWSPVKIALLACLAVNAPWLGLSAATGLIGFAIRMGARDPVAFVLPQLRAVAADTPVVLRTALAVCLRDEEVAPVFARLHDMAGEIAAAGLAARFVMCVLSDTASDAIARAEAEAVECLRAACGLNVLYRRRADNTGFKAGNVMSFLDQHANSDAGQFEEHAMRHAGQFDLMLCLDADSEMTIATIRRMVTVMQADSRLAILQATFHGAATHRWFPRLFGFGHRHGLRIWATGQAWWQADQGPYWGHNAVVRVAPFRAHCRLDRLPDGALILSHDHVEAARLQAAGWKLRVLADDTGSTESHPPTLPDYLGRDVRWAAGNMQYRHLLGKRDLGPLGRFQMLQAILHYVLTPFWFAMLPLAALNAATGGAAGVPRGFLLVLLAAGWLTLHAPKLLGYLEIMLRPGLAAGFGGRRRFVPQAAAELVYTLLLDPIIALQKTWAVLCLAFGRRTGWSTQIRGEHAVSWHDGALLFWPHTLAGAVLVWSFGQASIVTAAMSLPFTAGLLLAIPFTVLTTKLVRSGPA